MGKTWKEDACTVIVKAINEIGAETRTKEDIEMLFKHISREHYPFGERKYWPYKAWLSAIKQCREEYIKREFPRPTEPIDYNTGMFAE